MATTNQAIQILITLEYLGLYGGVPHFGVVLQTGVGKLAQGTLTIGPDIDKNLLEPWMWWDPTRSGRKPANLATPLIEIWRADPPISPSTPAGPPPTSSPILSKVTAKLVELPQSNGKSFYIEPSILDQLDADCGAALPKFLNGDHNLGWSDGSVTTRADARNTYPWPAHLAQVTRYPYPIPHLLNLSFFFKAEGFKPDGLDSKTYFFATVTFSAGVGGAKVTYGPPARDDKFPQPDKNSRLIIPLINSASPTDQSVAITTQSLPGPLVAAAGIVAHSDDEHTAETADWQAHFSSSVASTFDLSARLVDTVRQACDAPVPDPKNPPPTAQLRAAVALEFTGFVTAVITAQREIVAYGCQVGPNGKSLLDRLLDAWVGSSSDPKNSRTFADAFTKAVIAQRKSDCQDNGASFDAWLALLKTSPAFTTNSLLPPSSPGPTNITVFDPGASYKSGDTVIYLGRTFSAVNDVLAGNPLNGTSWRCLTPLLPFYMSGKTYQVGDRVLYQNAVYEFSSAQSPQQSAPPGGNWTAVSPFTPSVDAVNLADRLLAVEHLQLQLSQADILTQLLLAQWQAIFTSKSASIQNDYDSTDTLDAKVAFQSFVSSASASLAVWDVRGLLLQSNLGSLWQTNISTWSTITESPVKRNDLRTRIKAEIDNRLFTILLKNLPGSTAAFPAPVFAAQLKALVDTWVATRVPFIVPDPNTAATPAHATRCAQGLSVMVGTLDANGAKTVSGTDQGDSLRSVAGYCVLMRPSSDAPLPWQCLNAGIPLATVKPPDFRQGTSAVPAVHDPANPNALSAPIVIPLPIHNQDGLRRATLTYDNQPLMCSGPAHAFGAGLASAPTSDKKRGFDRMISFQHLSVTQDLQADLHKYGRWKIPGLAFKRSYDFLLGAVSSSGALPPEFADPTNPGIFIFDGTAKPSPHLRATIAEVPYLRTVPVGDLRFASNYYKTSNATAPGVPTDKKVGTFDKLLLPPIPDDVQPRASEVYTSAYAVKKGDALQPPKVGSAPEKPSTPLIVLSPYATDKQVSEFDLWIRKPTTDFLTWDRTQAALPNAGSPSRHQQRVWAWQLFHTNARKQKSDFDLSLEDPAIRSLTISVVGESGDVKCPDSQELKWDDAIIQDPKAATALQTRTLPILLRIITDAKFAAPTLDCKPAAGPIPPTFTLRLPAGFLGRITLTPNLKDDIRSHFAKNILPAEVKPYALLAETAQAAFPTAEQLQKALSVQPPITAAEPVTFTLATPRPIPSEWKQVSRVDLQTQVWRWDGRPARGYPFDDVVQPPSANLLQWELETFATRTASDSTIRPMTRDDANFVAKDDRGTELGATFYRAGITAYNRYGSFVPESARSAGTLNDFASIPGADGAWVRRFIPGRYAADGMKLDGYKPPKPAIKYIVPLTGASEGSQQAAASVLVVVQGPWFAIAGLAEDISVRIVDVDSKDHPEHKPTWKEAGPDPIYYHTGSPLPTSFDSYNSPFTPPDPNKKLLFHGPVGHTFDSSDTNPLWMTSSFVLDPPQEKFPSPKGDVSGVTQEGTFACIQFARVIRAPGMVVVPPPTSPLVKGIPQVIAATAARPPIPDIFSDFTDPVWVQFLPSRFLPVDPSQDFDNLVVNYDNKANKITICDAIRQPTTAIALTHNLHPNPKNNPNDYRFALLLTQEVPDLLGRRGQERFVDMVLQETSSGTATAAWNYTPNDGDDLLTSPIARIVVIQRQIKTTIGCKETKDTRKIPLCDVQDRDDLWPELFPDDPTQDAVSRIVAVSPPISAYNAKKMPLSCQTDPTDLRSNTAGGD